VVIAPPTLYLLLVREHLKPAIEVAAQNVFDKPNGAFTGEISVSQLSDSNITWAILGHSERRNVLGETDDLVASKTKYAIQGKIGVIWCCGESLEQRENGETIPFIEKQLSELKLKLSNDGDWENIVVAYEPIWAIGTGKVATVEQAQQVHAAIRTWLTANVSKKVADETRILYGGSVNAGNCKALAKEEDIDGFLVGGASLKPECRFLPVCRLELWEPRMLTWPSRRHCQLQPVASQHRAGSIEHKGEHGRTLEKVQCLAMPQLARGSFSLDYGLDHSIKQNGDTSWLGASLVNSSVHARSFIWYIYAPGSTGYPPMPNASRCTSLHI
jgi:triosephosphate isomerase